MQSSASPLGHSDMLRRFVSMFLILSFSTLNFFFHLSDFCVLTVKSYQFFCLVSHRAFGRIRTGGFTALQAVALDHSTTNANFDVPEGFEPSMPGSKPDVFRLSSTATLRDRVKVPYLRTEVQTGSHLQPTSSRGPDSNRRGIAPPAYKAGAVDH